MKVSIIVPVYNVEKYLRRCIDSLISQTLKDIEIILVDDGSPDNCGKIIDEYAKQYGNIIVVHKENGGLSDARNAGLNVATGEYIGFVDPDDYTEPQMYEIMYNSAKENDSDLVICGYNEIFSESYTEKRNFDSLKSSSDAESLVGKYINGEFGAYAWNKLYKYSVIKENNLAFPKGIQLTEDVIFLFDFLKYAGIYSVADELLYNYIRLDSSICGRYHKKQLEYYRAGYDSIKNTIDFLNLNDTELVHNNNINKLRSFLGVIDSQASLKNRISLISRYKEMSRIISDKEFLSLISDYGNEFTDKDIIKKIRYIKDNKKFNLFVYEFYKMRIVARIKYYLG